MGVGAVNYSIDDLNEFSEALTIGLLEMPNGQRIFDAGWRLAGFGQHRDSDSVERSNYEVALKHLSRHNVDEQVMLAQIDDLDADSDVVAYLRFRHWAVGWIEELVVHVSCPEALNEAHTTALYLRDEYPLLDEHHHAMLEHEMNHDGKRCFADYDCDCGMEKA